MPGVSLHFVLVEELLEGWRRRPRSAPFDLEDADAVEAFHQGSLGPDLGYFPGGERILSELAHRVRSADLARTLLAAARSNTERAFSWGWVAHVLGDKAIHPLVGLGVGEFLYRDRNLFVAGNSAPAVHVRVETGLDTIFRPRHRCKKAIGPVFDRASIGFLEAGYLRTYGLDVNRSALLASHAAVVRLARGSLALTGALARVFRGDRPGGLTLPIRWLLEKAHAVADRYPHMHALSLAYLTPVPPSDWLTSEVEKAVRSFPDLFGEHQEDRLAHLQNFDLDTGEVDVPGVPSSAAREILAQLDRSPYRLAGGRHSVLIEA